MSKKKAATNGTVQVQLPNRWVRVISSGRPQVCTECSRTQARGMMWLDGEVRACRPCGTAIAHRVLVKA